MKKNNLGFTLIEVILGLFIMGLLASVFLPNISSSMDKYINLRKKRKLIYSMEMIAEEIKAYDLEKSDEYIGGVKMNDLIEKFRDQTDVTIEIPEKTQGKNIKYKIKKTNKTDNLWKIIISAGQNKDKDIQSYEELKFFLQKK